MTDSGVKKLYTLKICEEYRQMVLPCGGDEIKRIEEQIRRFGCGEPISVWSGRLLVDYDRYEIFHRLRVPFCIINNSARNSEEVIEWICRNQLQRTDLTDAMRRYLIGKQFHSLKLLGAHHAASAPSPARNRRMSPAGVPRAAPKNSEKSSAVRKTHGSVVVLDGRQPACVLRLALRSPSSLPFFSLFMGTALSMNPHRSGYGRDLESCIISGRKP